MTTFKSRNSAFNKSGSNAAAPNKSGPPSTKFKGRGALPDGGFKRYPGAVANTESGNRRLAKSEHGDGGGSGTVFKGRDPFTY